MTAHPLVAALVALPLVVACATPYSEAPLASNFPTTNQQKLQAAAHWNVIAGDVAKQIAAKLKDKRPLFVSQASVKTEFDRAFSNQLISALVSDGFAVMKAPTGALTVSIDTQAVHFSADRPQYKHVGTATALTTGVWALRDVEATVARVLFAGVVVGASADAYTWFRSEFASGATPQTEIIVTTSVSDDNQYVARSTSIYYVADSDSRMYEHVPPFQAKTKIMGVTGQ